MTNDEVRLNDTTAKLWRVNYVLFDIKAALDDATRDMGCKDYDAVDDAVKPLRELVRRLLTRSIGAHFDNYDTEI